MQYLLSRACFAEDSQIVRSYPANRRNALMELRGFLLMIAENGKSFLFCIFFNVNLLSGQPCPMAVHIVLKASLADLDTLISTFKRT